KLVAENPGRTVRFVFLTTATITRERDRKHRTGDTPGLLSWEQVAGGADAAPLRAVLAALNLDPLVKEFIGTRDDDWLRRDLFQKIEWRCGEQNAASLAEDLRDRVAAYAFAHLKVPIAEGIQLADAVFVRVLQASVNPDRNRRVLRSANLLELLDT